MEFEMIKSSNVFFIRCMYMHILLYIKTGGKKGEIHKNRRKKKRRGGGKKRRVVGEGFITKRGGASI